MLAAPDTFTGTQYLSRRVDPLDLCQVSKCVPAIPSVLSPAQG